MARQLSPIPGKIPWTADAAESRRKRGVLKRTADILKFF
jgi:hypothetical protein